MPEFLELIQTFRDPGEDGLPEDFADQLQAAYDQTIDTYDTSSATLSEQLEAANTAREASEAAKKTAQQHNARLLRSLPASREESTSAEDNSSSTELEDSDQPTTIDSLIEYK